MAQRIILIPSFGTDSSLYGNLIPYLKTNFEILPIDWLPVNQNIEIEEYALRIIQKFNIKGEDIIIGTSLGGIMAIEIHKILGSNRIFSISSLLVQDEKPFLFKALRRSRLYLLWSPLFAKATFKLIRPYYGKNADNFLWFQRVFRNSDNFFLKWSFRKLITWENNYVPNNIILIHGDKDPVFPIKNSKRINHIIENGTHAMVRFKAQNIAQIINIYIS